MQHGTRRKAGQRRGAGWGRLVRPALSAAALSLFAGTAAADTLIEAWTRAYLTNPTIEAQRAQLRAVDNRVSQALSGWRPSVQFGANTGIAYQESNLSGGAFRNNSDTLYPTTLSLNALQPLYRGGRTLALTKRAERDVEAQRARLAATEQQLFLDIGTAYMAVLRDQAVVDLTRNNVRVIERQLQATRDRFSVGEVTRTDVAQAEARLARAIADRIQAEGNLEVSRTNYERLVGAPPGILAPPPPLPPPPESRAAAVDIALANNPNLFAAAFAAESAEAAVAAVEGELYPTINLSGALSRDWDRTTAGSRTDQAILTTELVVPLYQAGAVAARVREAKETAGQALALVEDARRAVIEDATESWESLTTAQASIESLQSQIEAAEIALEGVQQEALVGTRTVLDVLDQEQELLDARVSLVVAQRDLAVATLALAAATGRLTAEQLKLPVAYYDPDAHYEQVRNKWWGTDTSSSTTKR